MGQAKQDALHGRFWQFSFESRIQLRPDWPLPGAPTEPQLASDQLPLVAKVRTFKTAFR